MHPDVLHPNSLLYKLYNGHDFTKLQAETETLVRHCILKSLFPTIHVVTSLYECASTDSSSNCISHPTNLSPVSTLSDRPTFSFLFYSSLSDAVLSTSVLLSSTLQR